MTRAVYLHANDALVLYTINTAPGGRERAKVIKQVLKLLIV